MNPQAPSPLPEWLERAWLDRYLERRLDADETEWFETYVLDKPAMLRAIDADSDLRDGLAAAGTDALRVPASSPHQTSPRPLRPRTFALAALLALGVCAGWIAASLAGQAPAPELLVANPPRIVFDTLRGSERPARVEQPGANGTMAAVGIVIVDIAVPGDAERIVLRLDGMRELPLAAGPDGFATAIVPAALASAPVTAELHYRQAGRDVTRQLAWPAR